MSARKISFALIAAGISLFLLGFTYDVSVGGYVNIKKLSLQNNILLLGGIFFISGIILFAGSKKTTFDEKEINIASIPQSKESFVKKLTVVDQLFSIPKILLTFFISKNENLIGRMTTGIFVGTIAWIHVPAIISRIDFIPFTEKAGAISFTLLMIISTLKFQSKNVILSLLGFGILVLLISITILGIDAISDEISRESIQWNLVALLLAAPLLISITIFGFVFQKRNLTK